jgi:uncharacterized protein (DUF1778 family)
MPKQPRQNLRDIHLWLSPEDYAVIADAAYAEALSIPAFARALVIKQARALVEQKDSKQLGGKPS